MERRRPPIHTGPSSQSHKSSRKSSEEAHFSEDEPFEVDDLRSSKDEMRRSSLESRFMRGSMDDLPNRSVSSRNRSDDSSLRIVRLEDDVALAKSRIQTLVDSDILHKYSETKGHIEQLTRRISGIESLAKMAHEVTKLQQEDKMSTATLVEFKFNELHRKIEELELKLTTEREPVQITTNMGEDLEGLLSRIVNKRFLQLRADMEKESQTRVSLEERLTYVLQQNNKKLEEVLTTMEKGVHIYVQKEFKRLEDSFHQRMNEIKSEQEQQSVSILRKVKGKLEQIEETQKALVAADSTKSSDFKLMEKRINVLDEAVAKRISHIEETSRQQTEKTLSAFSKRILEIIKERSTEVETRVNNRMDRQLLVLQSEAQEIGKLEQRLNTVHEQARSKITQVEDFPYKALEQAMSSMENKLEEALDTKSREIEDRVANMARSLLLSEMERKSQQQQHHVRFSASQDDLDRLGETLRAIQAGFKMEIQKMNEQIDQTQKETTADILDKMETYIRARIVEIDHQFTQVRERMRGLTNEVSHIQTTIQNEIQQQLNLYRREYDSVSFEIRSLTRQMEDKTKEEARRLEVENAAFNQRLSSRYSEEDHTLAQSQNQDTASGTAPLSSFPAFNLNPSGLATASSEPLGFRAQKTGFTSPGSSRQAPLASDRSDGTFSKAQRLAMSDLEDL